MSESTSDTKTGEPDTIERAARRRFIKTVGAAGIAVPVIETLTGQDLLTTAAKAQTAPSGGLDGPMTGVIAGID